MADSKTPEGDFMQAFCQGVISSEDYERGYNDAVAAIQESVDCHCKDPYSVPARNKEVILTAS